MGGLGTGASPWRGTLLAALLVVSQLAPPRAEDRVEYRYEGYYEQDDRMAVNTSGVYFEAEQDAKRVLKGQFFYDSISGATPSGGPPRPDVSQVPLINFSDRRYAGNLGMDLRQGRLTQSPSFSYSYEHDYKRFGIAYTGLIDFNQRNTTLAIGLAHIFTR